MIVDEAHNLIETMKELHSASVSLAQLKRARHQVSFYLHKFQKMFKGKNRMYLAQLLRLLDSLRSYLESKKQCSNGDEGVVQDGDMLASKNADQIKIDKLLDYMKETKLAFKLDGYEQYMENATKNESIIESTQQRKRRPSAPALSIVEQFMLALTYPSYEGRFFYTAPDLTNSRDEDFLLKYQLLDPVHHFRDVVKESKAVILAGGTMSPMEEYFQDLFPYLLPNQVMTLSCGHVIPRHNLLAMPLGKGPQGTDFCFILERRTTPPMMEDLGLAILQAAESIPDGLVVFFTSYAYLNDVIKFWKKKSKNSGPSPIWNQLSEKKPIFLESVIQEPASTHPMSSSGHTSSPLRPTQSSESKKNRSEEVLAAYTAAINDPTNRRGALLFAVIGGSLSEGINFADRLGRGVIVVGLPFPNRKSPEWKAKLEFISKRAASSKEREELENEYITNACMRSVNQSIGRAIRHKDDYAAIMLLDARYQRHSNRKRLPGWIKESLNVGQEDFTSSLLRLERFFQHKRKA